MMETETKHVFICTGFSFIVVCYTYCTLTERKQTILCYDDQQIPLVSIAACYRTSVKV